MVVRLGQLARYLANKFAVVGKYYEDGVVVPRMLACLAQEVAYCPVGILHNLRLRLLSLRLEPLGYDVRRMVAYGEQRGKERLARGSLVVDFVEGIVEEEMVGHAKRVDNLILGIILLGIDVVVAVGGKKRLHVVVLCLVCHKEHVVVALLLEYGWYAIASWRNCALHEVAEH